MSKRLVASGTIFAAMVLAPAAGGWAAVTLNFVGPSMSTSANVSPGGTFAVDVVLGATSASDDITGVDYRLSASASKYFEIISRVSTGVLNPYNTDGSSNVKSVVLSPTSGSPDLGGNLPNGASDIRGGGATFDLATYTIEALPATPTSVYTLSFVPGLNSTGYQVGSPSYRPDRFRRHGHLRRERVVDHSRAGLDRRAGRRGGGIAGPSPVAIRLRSDPTRDRVARVLRRLARRVPALIEPSPKKGTPCPATGSGPPSSSRRWPCARLLRSTHRRRW